jgi:hypothetical protein
VDDETRERFALLQAAATLAAGHPSDMNLGNYVKDAFSLLDKIKEEEQKRRSASTSSEMNRYVKHAKESKERQQRLKAQDRED